MFKELLHKEMTFTRGEFFMIAFSLATYGSLMSLLDPGAGIVFVVLAASAIILLYAAYTGRLVKKAKPKSGKKIDIIGELGD